MEEGYIKFKAHWQKAAPFPWETLRALDHWRQQMYQQQLIGAYPDGIGYGNISCRFRDTEFLISGSTTGNFPQLNAQHYTLVTDFDLQRNEVFCQGPIIASSESMTHAVVYQHCPEVNAVIHIHQPQWWEHYLHQLPTSSAQAAYGTPEMAQEIIRLLETSSVRQQEKVLVMAGHREGFLAFGVDLAEAGEALLALAISPTKE